MVWHAEDTNDMSSSNKIDSVIDKIVNVYSFINYWGLRNCQIGFKFYQFLPKSVRSSLIFDF